MQRNHETTQNQPHSAMKTYLPKIFLQQNLIFLSLQVTDCNSQFGYTCEMAEGATAPPPTTPPPPPAEVPCEGEDEESDWIGIETDSNVCYVVKSNGGNEWARDSIQLNFNRLFNRVQDTL